MEGARQSAASRSAFLQSWSRSRQLARLEAEASRIGLSAFEAVTI